MDSSSDLQTAERTERGARPVNEDSVLCRSLADGRWLAAVADGMGGMQAGQLASRTAIDALLEMITRGVDLVRAVEAAHEAILERGTHRPMGTTLVAALIDGRGLEIASVGDSRAYLLGPAGLVQVTRDHTFGAEAAERGVAGAEHVIDTRWGRALTRSLGTEESLEVDRFGPFRLDDGVRLLLCSDGVHGVLTDDTIERCLNGVPDLGSAVDRLIDAALEEGSEDNLSAVVVQFGAVNGSERMGQVDDVPRNHVPMEMAVEEAAAEKVAFDDTAAEGSAPPVRPAPEVQPPPVRFGSLPSTASRASEPADPGPWDLATLVARSHNPMRRKPGRLQAMMLVVALLAAVAAIVALIRLAQG
jgi:serine/threonine protein phosphatase PrpC